MSIDLQFDGTTEARGRNGWFQLREGLINAYPGVPEVYVNLYSKSHSKTAPIFLCFHTPEELRTLICGLAKALAQMTTIAEETTDGI
jgi:hypothetical protein